MNRPPTCTLARLCVLQDYDAAWGPDGRCRGCAMAATAITEAMVRASPPRPVRVKRAGGKVWVCQDAPQDTNLAIVGEIASWLAQDVDTGEVFVVTGHYQVE